MFALLALAGDLGCSAGPTVVGMVSGAYNDDLRKGILYAILFPFLLLVGLSLYKKLKVRT
jgi:MFS-type transporter involved in bile tolerance (Atg22 family)